MAFDEFDTMHAPPRFALSYEDLTLEIKGRARLGLHDLQGEGGPGYDSPTDTATIGTRSPFVELDSFELAFRLNWQELLWLNTNVTFTTAGASLGAIYFEYKQDLETWFSHGAEIGYQNSIVATHRHTVRYPLIATQYWKNPEYHAAYGARFQPSENTSIVLYASVSMMRPLKSEPIHGSSTYAGSLKTLSYGTAKAFSGNSAAGTALVRISTHGFTAEGFTGSAIRQIGYNINTLTSIWADTNPISYCGTQMLPLNDHITHYNIYYLPDNTVKREGIERSLVQDENGFHTVTLNEHASGVSVDFVLEDDVVLKDWITGMGNTALNGWSHSVNEYMWYI
jgi:hypothetical protein